MYTRGYKLYGCFEYSHRLCMLELQNLLHSFLNSQLCLSPLTPWSKFPLRFPFPLLSLPLPSIFLPLEVVPPLLRLGGLSGGRFSSPSGSAKRYLVNFRLKISPLVAAIFRSFSGNETSNYDRHVGCLLGAFSLKLRGSALLINALPPKFLQTRFPPPTFSMVHLLHRLCGVDVPEYS